jgi:hypothetical protein
MGENPASHEALVEEAEEPMEDDAPMVNAPVANVSTILFPVSVLFGVVLADLSCYYRTHTHAWWHFLR